MPGPFPGMDPYLESSSYWRGLHSNLITYLTAALNAGLPNGYAAITEERMYVVNSDHGIIPDLTLLRQFPTLSGRAKGGMAVAERADEPGIITIYPETNRERFIEIRALKEQGRVVTIIELLSPSNKMTVNKGRAEYLKKQQEVMDSEVNLLEIDLLRSGTHTVAASREALLKFGNWDYLVCLHRGIQDYTFEYWMNSIRSPLPRVKVPLTEGLEDCVLDLQAAFDSAYDGGPYYRLVDYSKDPQPPLSEVDAVWADALLREKCLRP